MPRIGQYELVGEIGRGGMGVVYRGFDPLIRRDVAIKTIRLFDADANERRQLQERLEREAQSAGRLSHPNIVTIYQIGYDTTEAGEALAYIVMEFVAGQTLGQLLATGYRPDRDSLLEILGQTAEALDYAHSHGVVHRDIKPANLLLSPDRRVKIADFGIAKITSSTMTQSGMMVGSPHYMAPEQVRASGVDGRADQYSLAVVAYEMLAGRKPFEADSMTALVYQIAHEETPTASLLQAGLSHVAINVVRRAMAKNAAERYPTCREMVAALGVALQPTAVHPAPQPKPKPVPAPKAQATPVPVAAEPASGRGRGLFWAVGLGVPVLLGGAAILWHGQKGKSEPAGANTEVATVTSIPEESRPSSTTPTPGSSGTGTQPVISRDPRWDRNKAMREEPRAAIPTPSTASSPVSQRSSPPAANPLSAVSNSQPSQPAAPPPPVTKPEPTVTPPQQQTPPPQSSQPQQTPPVQAASACTPAPDPPATAAVRTPPRLIFRLNPAYTLEARRAGIQGPVAFRITVDPTGAVSHLELVKGLDSELDKRAAAAVTRWRFDPATENGRPVPWSGVVSVEYKLMNARTGGPPTLRKQPVN